MSRGLIVTVFLEKLRSISKGTDVAALLGLNPYKTPLDLWEEKTGKRESAPASEAAH